MRCDLPMNGKYTPKRNSKARGFTILELVVTVALLAIVLLIAIPNFHRITVNSNLKTAARDLVADFNALRERALAENREYRLSFNGNQYTLEACTDATTPCAAWGPPPAGVATPKSPASIASDITLTSHFGGPVIFLTRGTVNQAGNVVLTNGRVSTATITCNISGRTSVSFTWN